MLQIDFEKKEAQRQFLQEEEEKTKQREQEERDKLQKQQDHLNQQLKKENLKDIMKDFVVIDKEPGVLKAHTSTTSPDGAQHVASVMPVVKSKPPKDPGSVIHLKGICFMKMFYMLICSVFSSNFYLFKNTFTFIEWHMVLYFQGVKILRISKTVLFTRF